jgi:hypothetical protein
MKSVAGALLLPPLPPPPDPAPRRPRPRRRAAFGPPRFYPTGCLPASALPTWFFSSGAGNLMLAGLVLPLWLHAGVQAFALAVVAAKIPRLCACVPAGGLGGVYAAVAAAHGAWGGSLLSGWLPTRGGAAPCAAVLAAGVAAKTLLLTTLLSLATEATARAWFLQSAPAAAAAAAADAAVAAPAAPAGIQTDPDAAGGSGSGASGSGAAAPWRAPAPAGGGAIGSGGGGPLPPARAALRAEIFWLAARLVASSAALATALPLVWEAAVAAAAWASAGGAPRVLEVGAVATSLALQAFMRWAGARAGRGASSGGGGGGRRRRRAPGARSRPARWPQLSPHTHSTLSRPPPPNPPPTPTPPRRYWLYLVLTLLVARPLAARILCPHCVRAPPQRQATRQPERRAAGDSGGSAARAPRNGGRAAGR